MEPAFGEAWRTSSRTPQNEPQSGCRLASGFMAASNLGNPRCGSADSWEHRGITHAGWGISLGQYTVLQAARPERQLTLADPSIAHKVCGRGPSSMKKIVKANEVWSLASPSRVRYRTSARSSRSGVSS